MPKETLLLGSSVVQSLGICSAAAEAAAWQVGTRSQGHSCPLTVHSLARRSVAAEAAAWPFVQIPISEKSFDCRTGKIRFKERKAVEQSKKANK